MTFGNIIKYENLITRDDFTTPTDVSMKFSLLVIYTSDMLSIESDIVQHNQIHLINTVNMWRLYLFV